MSSISETSAWIKFFTGAGIPASEATNYAILFADNRIKQNMLMDLTCEYLREMGISVMGDVIAILKHAKNTASTISRQRVMADQGLLKNGSRNATLTSTGKKSTPATRMLEHYVRKDPPAISNQSSPLSARIGDGTLAKKNSVFDRLGDNCASSDSSLSNNSKDNFNNNSSSLEYQGVLKYSTIDGNKRARAIAISKSAAKLEELSSPVKSSAIKKRLGVQTAGGGSSSQSAGIFAKENETAMKSSKAIQMVKPQSLKRPREEMSAIVTQSSAKRFASESSLRSDRLVKSVRRTASTAYMDKEISSARIERTPNLPFSRDVSRAGFNNFNNMNKSQLPTAHMDRIAKPIKLKVMHDYSDDAAEYEKRSSMKARPSKLNSQSYSSDSAYSDDDYGSRKPMFSSKTYMDAVAKPMKINEVLNKKSSQRKVISPQSKSAKYANLEPLKIKISQNTKQIQPSKVKRSIPQKTYPLVDKKRMRLKKHRRTSDDSKSSDSSTDSDDNEGYSDTRRVGKMDVDKDDKTDDSDDRMSDRDSDQYLPTLPKCLENRNSSAPPKRTLYKKIVKINKKTGEIISEEKQALKGGVFGRLSL